MPAWILVVLGGVGGVVIVAGVFVLAFLPELRPRPETSWLAPPSGREDFDTDTDDSADPGPTG